MKIIQLTLGQLSTNCYLAIDEASQKTVIIDPADDADFITDTILREKLLPTAIILTHGHYDHLLAVLELKLNFNIPVYLHKDDEFLYKKSHLSAVHFSGSKALKVPPVNGYLKDNEKIIFGSSELTVIHTPGHTPGSVCLSGKNILFTGDTLFLSGVGRTDLSYSSTGDLKHSLKIIKALPSETLVYPGHEDFGFFLSEIDFSFIP